MSFSRYLFFPLRLCDFTGDSDLKGGFRPSPQRRKEIEESNFEAKIADYFTLNTR